MILEYIIRYYTFLRISCNLFCLKCNYLYSYAINKSLITASCWHSQHKCDYITYTILPVERVSECTPTQYTMKLSRERFLYFYYASIVVDDKYIIKMCEYDREYFTLLTMRDLCHNLKYTMIPILLLVIYPFPGNPSQEKIHPIS